MNRFWILLGAFVVALVPLGLAVLLGTWAFEFYKEAELDRRLAVHEGALRRVMEKEPTIDPLTQGLAEFGTALLLAPETPADVRRAIETHGGVATDALRQKARRWPILRVFWAADAICFIFFDDDEVMRDFACVGT